MTGNVSSVDHLGADSEELCASQHLFLKPIAIIRITVMLPKITIPGQSISNWDLMEKLKKAVYPIQLESIRVRESSMESVIFEAELLSQGVMKKTMKVLDAVAMKVSGFAEPLRVKTCEPKSDFPSRHDWDLFYMKNKMDETKPGERPDTIYLAKIPVNWFNDGSNDQPSEKRLKRAMEVFGTIRAVDIPMCDPMRTSMSPKIAGFQIKGFGVKQDLFFEAYVQYMEYKAFATAMEALRNKKWAKRIDGKFYQQLVKVDFDRTRHLSAENIEKRAEERRRILNEKLRKEENEHTQRLEAELRAKREEYERELRREERERKRKEKKELEREQEFERKRIEAENRELERRAMQRRILESQRLLEHLFDRIAAKEERRKRREEEKLKETLSRIDQLDEQPVEKEEALRMALLKHQEMRMRERLKEKMLETAKKCAKNGDEKKMKVKKSKKVGHKRASRQSSSDESDVSSESSSDSEVEKRKKKKHIKKKSHEKRERSRGRMNGRTKSSREQHKKRRRISS